MQWGAHSKTIRFKTVREVRLGKSACHEKNYLKLVQVGF